MYLFFVCFSFFLVSHSPPLSLCFRQYVGKSGAEDKLSERTSNTSTTSSTTTIKRRRIQVHIGSLRVCPCLCSCVLDLCVGFFCSLLDLFPLVLVIYLIIIIFFFFCNRTLPSRRRPTLPFSPFSSVFYFSFCLGSSERKHCEGCSFHLSLSLTFPSPACVCLRVYVCAPNLTILSN